MFHAKLVVMPYLMCLSVFPFLQPASVVAICPPLFLRRPFMPPKTDSTTRRDFARNALQSLTAFVLVEGLWSRRLLGEDVKPIVDAWFNELYTISRDVHERR